MSLLSFTCTDWSESESDAYDSNDDDDDNSDDDDDDDDNAASGDFLFAATDTILTVHDDHDGQCKAEFGAQWSIADWNHVVLYYESGGNMNSFFNDVDWVEEPYTGRFILRDGDAFLYGDRHYFIARHDHVVPGGWSVHDHIDDHLIDLGSWYDDMHTLCVTSAK